MARSVPWVDRFSITLSTLCIMHCLLLPLLLIGLPSLAQTFLSNEALHLALVYAVIPSSLFALGMGCRQHQRSFFLVIGLLGLGFLLFGIAVEPIGIDHLWEKVFTVVGALLIAFAHVRNFCLLYTSPSPRDGLLSRMPSSA